LRYPSKFNDNFRHIKSKIAIGFQNNPSKIANILTKWKFLNSFSHYPYERRVAFLATLRFYFLINTFAFTGSRQGHAASSGH